jgi:hypothetical protein
MVNMFYLDNDPVESAKCYHDLQVRIMVDEVCQILYRVLHHVDPKIEYPFDNIKMIKIGINTCQWILESIENYKYALNIGLTLLSEHKFRFGGETHICDDKYEFLKDNLPDLPKKKITKFKLSKNVESYHTAFEKTLDACRLSFVDYKLLKKRYWRYRSEPKWIKDYQAKSEKIKRHELDKLNNLIIQDSHYDELLGKGWKKNKFMYGKFLDLDKDLLPQLGCGHLVHLCKIINKEIKSQSDSYKI